MGQPSFDSWQPVTVAELEAFMGFILLMGIINLPALFDYWKKRSSVPLAPVASRISRTRFFEISKYLHIANNQSLAPTGTPEYSKLEKIEPILKQLGERFQRVNNLNKDVSVEEAMIPFKGRSSMKQYLPLKPTKRGIKVWVLADAHTCYVSRLQVYTGRSGEKSNNGLGASVVKNLCQSIKKR